MQEVPSHHAVLSWRTCTPFKTPSVAWNVAEVGLRVGADVGRGVGADGLLDGLAVGLGVGPSVGLNVGLTVGPNVGLVVGAGVGLRVGRCVGEVGLVVGLSLQRTPLYMVSLYLPTVAGFVLFHAGRTSMHMGVPENTETGAPWAVS